MPLVVPPRLHSIAAGFLAEATGLVLAGIEEQPITLLAFPEVLQVGGSEQLCRRLNNRPQDAGKVVRRDAPQPSNVVVPCFNLTMLRRLVQQVI